MIEYMEGYSLQDLINNVGCLNEELLNKIIIQIIDCLQEYQDKYKVEYKEFCPCDIVFDKNCNLKV